MQMNEPKKTQMEMVQSLTPKELVIANTKKNKKRKSRRDDLIKKNYKVVPDNAVFLLKESAEAKMRTKPSFNILRRDTLSETFLKLFPPTFVQQLITHNNVHYQHEDKKLALSLQKYYQFLATKYYCMYLERNERKTQDKVLSDGLPKGFMPRTEFYKWKKVFIIPPELLKDDLSAIWSRMVNVGDGVTIVDERKQEYHGHTDCISMIRGKPTLWMSQVMHQADGAAFAFCSKVWAFHTNSKPTKVELAQWYTKDNTDAIVADSFYSSLDAVEYLESINQLYLTSLHNQWWNTETKVLMGMLVDEGATANLHLPMEQVASDEREDVNPDVDEYVEDVIELEYNELKDRVKKGPSQDTVGSMKIGKRIIQGHWFRLHNKKTYGVRAVATNMYRPVEANREKGTAEINSAYTALYGIGSDHFNTFMTKQMAQHSAYRGDGHLAVFDWVTTFTLLQNTWCLMQINGMYRVNRDPRADDKLGVNAFTDLLKDLGTELLEFSKSLSEDDVDEAGYFCGCEMCQQQYKVALDPQQEVLRQNERTKLMVKEAHEKEAKHRRAAENKRIKEEKSKQFQETKAFNAKRKREYQEGVKERKKHKLLSKQESLYLCTTCKDAQEERTMLGCSENVKHWECQYCHGLRGNAFQAAAYDDDWVCGLCTRDS